MRNFLKTGKNTDCCGCSACLSACPKQCISFQKNEEGFLYPIKDMNLCIDCSLCEKVCPFSDNYTYETTAIPVVYAAYDKENRVGSSSGGVFYTLAKYVIEECAGWVFGAAFEDKFQLRHLGVNKMSDLHKLRGSKYLQSDLRDCYPQIKRLLIEGVFVLFVGTPCQVAGLRAFLRNKEYDNLLIADLVCHGVPSQSLFDEHVKYLEQKHKATLVSYQFRKADGWGGCEIADFTNPIKQKVLPTYSLSPYLYSFMQAYTYRESCYECKFAQIPRQGDITLADYWGADKFFTGIDISKGVSLVLLNTEKGKALFNDIKENCVIYESNLQDASCYNPNLVTKTVRPAIRDKVFMLINKEGYNKLARTLFRIKGSSILQFKLWLLSFPFFSNLQRNDK